MTKPEGHVVLGEEEVYQAQERYAALEVELQVMLLCNEKLTGGLREQEEVLAVKRLRVGRRAQAQMREFVNLMAELMAGSGGPEVQLDGMRIGVKIEKPENYDSSK